MQLTNYIIATLCKFPEAYSVLRSPMFIQKEFALVKTGDITPVFNAAFFGRVETARVLKELSDKEDLKEVVFEMFLQRDNNKSNCIELSVMDIDLQKFDVTQQERDEIRGIMMDLSVKAYKHAKKGGEKWADLLRIYMQGKSTLEVFGKDV